jgi:hypothetical protein
MAERNLDNVIDGLTTLWLFVQSNEIILTAGSRL